MTIYTVVSVDELDMETLDYNIVGSYVRRGDALMECAKCILERAEMRCDLEHMLLHDENHKDFPRRGKKKRLEYLIDKLGGDSYYCICCGGYGSFHFSVCENDVEGEFYELVTWGDSDLEDPCFTTPGCEVFTDKALALLAAANYARDLICLYNGNSKERAQKEANEIARALDEDGESMLTLDDGTAAHWKLCRRRMEKDVV